MERNTQTRMYYLQPGDRFYKANDKKKIVYQKVDSSLWVTYKLWAVLAATYDLYQGNENLVKRDAVSIKGDTEVIFLRSNNAM